MLLFFLPIPLRDPKWDIDILARWVLGLPLAGPERSPLVLPAVVKGFLLKGEARWEVYTQQRLLLQSQRFQVIRLQVFILTVSTANVPAMFFILRERL